MVFVSRVPIRLLDWVLCTVPVLSFTSNTERPEGPFSNALVVVDKYEFVQNNHVCGFIVLNHAELDAEFSHESNKLLLRRRWSEGFGR